MTSSVGASGFPTPGLSRCRRCAGLPGLALFALASAVLPPGRVAAQQPPPAADPAKATVKASEDGFVIESADGAYRLRFSGYAQLDGRFYPGDDAELATDSFLLRRVRPILSGTLAKRFDFYLNPDFGGGTTVLQDAWLDVRFSGAARVRIGKMKAPVGLERLQSGSALNLVERALPSALVPNRDLGVQLHGELRGGRIAYAAGLFNGAVDGGSSDTDTGDSKDVAARVLFQPLRTAEKSALRGLAFGVAGTLGDQTGALPSYRSGGQLVFFSYAPGARADGRRTRVVPQATFHLGRFGAQGEWARSCQEITNASARAPIANAAWQATASFVITGEPASLAGVRPKRAFDPAAGAWGALELVARANALEVDAAAFAHGFADAARSARSAEAWAVGLNWYLNRNVKLVASYERTRFEGGAGDRDRPTENALFFRAQLAY